MSAKWTVTDVKPHIMLCPLPKGYRWQVNFIMRMNSCHMRLHRGHWWSTWPYVGDTTVVLNVSDKSPEQITKELIEGSYTVWQDWFRKVDSNQQDWINTARQVELDLRQRTTTVKFKIDRGGVKN